MTITWTRTVNQINIIKSLPMTCSVPFRRLLFFFSVVLLATLGSLVTSAEM